MTDAEKLAEILRRVRAIHFSGTYDVIQAGVTAVQSVMVVVSEVLKEQSDADSGRPAPCGQAEQRLPGPGVEHGPDGCSGGGSDPASQRDVPDPR